MDSENSIFSDAQKCDITRKRILVADDNELNRVLLTDMLVDEFDILEAVNGQEAVDLLEQYGTDIDLVLLDIVMPVMDGFGVLSVMRHRGWIEDIPVIMISAETSTPYTKKAYDLGATDFIKRPFDPQIVHRRITNTIVLYAKQKRLMDVVAAQVQEQEKNNNLMVSILSHIVEFRNGESGLHVLHINAITEILLNALTEKTDQYRIPKSDFSIIRMASSLHDIGKISTPEEILNKPGRLTPEEFRIMKEHSMAGAHMMEQLPFFQDEPLVRYSYQICRWHHERWDGHGYPDGLSGDRIPIAAQVVSLADVYDALTSPRCYKPAYSRERALEMILGDECGVFNPLLLDCLREREEEIWEHIRVTSPADVPSNAKSVGQNVMDALHAYEKNLPETEETSIFRACSSITDEYWFESTADRSAVWFNPAARERFSLPETVEREDTRSILAYLDAGELFESLTQSIAESTPQRPEFYLEMAHPNYGFLRFLCRTVWEPSGRCAGIVGRIVETDSQRSEII